MNNTNAAALREKIAEVGECISEIGRINSNLNPAARESTLGFFEKKGLEVVSDQINDSYERALDRLQQLDNAIEKIANV